MMKSTKPNPEKLDFKKAVLEILQAEQLANSDEPLVVSLLERVKNKIEKLDSGGGRSTL